MKISAQYFTILTTFFLVTSCNVKLNLTGGNHTKISSKTEFEWSDSTLKLLSKRNHFFKTYCDSTLNMGNLPILIVNKQDTLYNDTKNCAQIILVIESKKVGPLWMPIYKRAWYYANGSGYLTGILTNDSMINQLLNKETIQCTFKTKGRISIFGLSSQTNARTRVENQIIENLLSIMSSRLKEIKEKGITQ